MGNHLGHLELLIGGTESGEIHARKGQDLLPGTGKSLTLQGTHLVPFQHRDKGLTPVEGDCDTGIDELRVKWVTPTAPLRDAGQAACFPVDISDGQ